MIDQSTTPQNAPLEDRTPRFFRKPDGGYVRPVFTREGLAKLAGIVPSYDDGKGRWYGLALLVLEFVFGYKWVEKHILDEPKKGFLARTLTITGGESGSNIVMHRVRDLAELVANLLPVQGVESPLDLLAGGDIEPGYAELEVGKLLLMHNVPFRFIWPSGVKGESFDLEIVFPNGQKVCADTKCKIETEAFSENSIINTLDVARKRNLPKGYPGAIFVKIPQKWFENATVLEKALETCRGYFRGTRRIVYINLYRSLYELRDNIIHDWLAGSGIRSHNHDFSSSLTDEPLFSPASKASLPKGWIRLSEFYK